MNLDQYRNLLSDVKSLLLHDFPKEHWLNVNADTYSYFKGLALQSKPATPAPTPQRPPVPVQPVQNKPPAPPPPPPPSQPIAQVKPETPPPPPPKPQVDKSPLTLEPLSAPTSIDFSETRKFFAEKFPQLELVDTIPPDHKAKEIANYWKLASASPEVIILSFNESAPEKSILQNMAAALTKSIAPTRVIEANKIEQEKGWNKLLQSENLRLIIASNYSIYSLPEFMNHYREDSQACMYFVGKIRLYLLSDLSLYIQQPQLKAPLWRALCDILSKR
jgi:hypothetical protein